MTPRTYRDTLVADRAQYGDFAVGMLDEGITLLQDGRWYLSTAHTEREVEDTLSAVDRILR
jgi:glutamate-1-semialdehyde 2,1-aminomutase